VCPFLGNVVIKDKQVRLEERRTLDKYEYKVRADEIKELISKGEYVQAAEIADTIDWRRVKSIMMLCTISDLYKINRRYEDARDMLLLAYERRPGGRTICYSLCELSIKMEEFVEAVEYYKEFVQVAPKDPGRYVLQYKLYEAQDVSLEERIAVLEELKKRDYREKWAYELAYLYHRIGLAARCVEECDELILWFGDGKYVIKAMELKMLHQPLTADQQAKYDRRFVPTVQEAPVESEAESVQEQPAAEDILLQKTTVINTEEVQAAVAQESDAVTTDTQVYTPVGHQEETTAEELDIHVKTMDVSQYNTMNLQAEIAAGLREILNQEKPVIEDPITRSIMAPMLEADTESLDYPEIDEVSEDDLEAETGEMEGSEVFFGETGEIKDITAEMVLAQMRQETVQEAAPTEEVAEAESSVEAEVPAVEDMQESAETKFVEVAPQEPAVASELVVTETTQATQISFADTMLRTEPPKELARVLTQGADGQLSLVIPESERVEKQITGQISIDDILIEWERIKKENQEKRENQVRQHVLEHTGNLFTEFELSVRDGLLEKLEREKLDAEALNEETVVEEDTAEEAEIPAELAEETTAEEAVEEEITETVEEAVEEEMAETVEETVEEEITETVEEAVEEEMAETEEEAVEEKIAETVEEAVEEEITETEEEAVEEEITETVEEAVEEEIAETEEETIEEEVISEEDEVEELEEIADPAELAEEADPEESAETEEIGETKEVSEQSAPKEEITRERPKLRALTKEEKVLYAPFIQTRSAKEQLINAIDRISMAAYTGNVIITGEKGMDTLALAKNMMKELQASDSNFSGKVAKISGAALNKKDVAEVLGKLKNGALIVEGASDINKETAHALHKALQQETYGIVVVLEDSRKAMDRFLEEHTELHAIFTARVDVKALNNDTLVAFGRQYAREKEYSIDDFGVLALHTRIEELQTLDHAVTVVDVKELVDDAIYRANRKNLKHFFDILLGKRYDEEDMIILGEKDFA